MVSSISAVAVAFALSVSPSDSPSQCSLPLPDSWNETAAAALASVPSGFGEVSRETFVDGLRISLHGHVANDCFQWLGVRLRAGDLTSDLFQRIFAAVTSAVGAPVRLRGTDAETGRDSLMVASVEWRDEEGHRITLRKAKDQTLLFLWED